MDFRYKIRDGKYYDTFGDFFLTPEEVLTVLNYHNQNQDDASEVIGKVIDDLTKLCRKLLYQ